MANFLKNNGYQFNPETGLLESPGAGVDVAGSTLENPLHDATAPGAGQAIPTLDNTAAVNSAMQAVQAENDTAAAEQQTEAQKAAADQANNEAEAQKKALDAQKAAIDAKQAGERAGLVSEAGITSEGAPLIQEGMVQSTVGQQKQVEASYDEQESALDGMLDQETGLLSQQKADLEAVFDYEKAAREQPAIDLEEINGKIGTVINSKVSAPSMGLAGLLAVVFGELGSRATGGRNVAYEMLTKKAEQEVEIELANNRMSLAGLRDQRGIARDKRGLVEEDIASKKVMMAQKYANLAKRVELEAAKEHITAEKSGKLMELAGDLKQRMGAFQLDAAKAVAEMELSKREASLNEAKQRQSAMKDRRSAAAKPAEHALYKPGTFIYHADSGRMVDMGDPTVREALEKDKSKNEHRYQLKGASFEIDGQTSDIITIKDVEDRKKFTKDTQAYHAIRSSVQNSISLIDAMPDGVKSATDLKLNSIIGTGSKEAKALNSAFQNLSAVMKKELELGAALTKDELALMNGAIYGTDKDAFFANTSLSEFKSQLEVLQERSELAARRRIGGVLRLQGDDIYTKIHLKDFKPTKYEELRKEAKDAEALVEPHEKSAKNFSTLVRQQELSKEGKVAPPSAEAWKASTDLVMKQYSRGKYKKLDKANEQGGTFSKKGSFALIDHLRKLPKEQQPYMIQKLKAAKIDPPGWKRQQAELARVATAAKKSLQAADKTSARSRSGARGAKTSQFAAQLKSKENSAKNSMYSTGKVTKLKWDPVKMRIETVK